MSAAGAAPPTLLRRAIRLIKRSPLLTRAAWRLYQSFPALGRIVAQRAIRPTADQHVRTPVLIVPASAWDDAVSSADRFERQLNQAIRQATQQDQGGRR